MAFPQLRRPIVLVHGLLGYDFIRLGGRTILSYFVGLPEALSAAGNRVLVPRLSPTAGIAQRAAELRDFLHREAPGEQLHILAHSMGGLDSRYLISRLGFHEHVCTLTTLGTPHRGTAFADWGIRRVEPFLRALFDFVGLSRQAFHDLTTAHCRQFNDEVPDAPGVRYYSVAGRLTLDWRAPEWQLPHRIIAAVEGDNDGLVSLASAAWGEEAQVWDGDHASLVNRPMPTSLIRGAWRDRLPDYEPLLERLADQEAQE